MKRYTRCPFPTLGLVLLKQGLQAKQGARCATISSFQGPGSPSAIPPARKIAQSWSPCSRRLDRSPHGVFAAAGSHAFGQAGLKCIAQANFGPCLLLPQHPYPGSVRQRTKPHKLIGKSLGRPRSGFSSFGSLHL